MCSNCYKLTACPSDQLVWKSQLHQTVRHNAIQGQYDKMLVHSKQI